MIVPTMPPQVNHHEAVTPCSQVPGVKVQRHMSALGDSFVTIDVPGGRTIVRPKTARDAKGLLVALGDLLGKAMTAALNSGLEAGRPGPASVAEDATCSTSTRTPAASGAKSRRG